LPEITQAKLAEILGVSRPRVSQLKSKGRFEGTYRKKGGTILYDQEAAVAAWNGEIDQLTTRVAGSEQEIPSFNESRAKSEHFRAELARLDLEIKEEKLCEADKVKREAFSMARSVRDALNSIPDRVANQFAAETDPVVIHQALSEELRKALERLTDG
jgi:phage terminase Nu1 subunit (DNA packaging protein)